MHKPWLAQEHIPRCDLLPTFTLLAGGSVYYIDGIDGDRRQTQTMAAYLTPDEAKALVQRVLDFGFACLANRTSQGGPWSTQWDEAHM